jgi:uncharacterized protein CbrC (UPF0167 family)
VTAPDPLPVFPYHPDPLETGSVAPSDAVCRSCERARGYIYTGPVFAEQDLAEAFCPWCIADGLAAERFQATFTDPDGIGDYGSWDPVPREVVVEVSQRTPGFSGWQQERWWTHCGDAAEFLGPAGHADLEAKWAMAVPSLMMDVGMEGETWLEYFAELDAEGSPTAYVFRCRQCGQLGGYSDCD